MKKILFSLLVVGLSLGFAGCSSDDRDNTPPYLNIENESITIPYETTKIVVRIKTNEDWTVVSDHDWLRVIDNADTGDADIRLYCWTNESYKERKATITIKTPSFNKEITIIQNRDNRLRIGDNFGILKESSVVIDKYHYNNYKSSAYVLPFRETLDTYLSYKGIEYDRPRLSVGLRIENVIPTAALMLYIFLNECDPRKVMTREEALDLFLEPYYIAYPKNPFKVKITESNVTKKNLIISRSGNEVTYRFNNFRIYDGAWTHILDGKMVFELKVN